MVESKSQAGAAEIKKLRARRRDMETNYDQFLATLHVYNRKMSEQDKLVLRVASIFGESPAGASVLGPSDVASTGSLRRCSQRTLTVG